MTGDINLMALISTLKIARAANTVTTLSYEEVIRIYCREAAKSNGQPDKPRAENASGAQETGAGRTLEALKHDAPNHPRGVGFNEGVDACIAALERTETPST